MRGGRDQRGNSEKGEVAGFGLFHGDAAEAWPIDRRKGMGSSAELRWAFALERAGRSARKVGLRK